MQLELNVLLDKESLMWHQRSKALFLKEGDRNTRYFHSKASQRFRRNRILGLRNGSNVWCLDDSQVKEVATQYYQALFSSSQPTELDVVLEAIQPSVTQEMNDLLIRPFVKEEVVTVINQMEPITTPDPDGMPPYFLSILLVFYW